MAVPVRKGYSALQIGLHWLVALLIVFQFLFHDPMEKAWDALRDGLTVPADSVFGSNLHAATGLLILVLALLRLGLRFRRGAPALPGNEPALLKMVANGTHVLLYALIIAMPLGGAAAWFLGVAPAARVHGLAATVLFWLAALHILGAFFQQFVLRTNILARMAVPEE
jgi:cytochrome b561